MPTCAIYLRVSKEDQAAGDRLSLPTQNNSCLAVAAARGDEVGAVYVDAGASAFADSIAGRPEFVRLLQDARVGRFSRLYVYCLDRFSRADVGAAGEWLRILQEAGVELVSCLEWFDSSPAGEFMRNMLLSQSRYFSRLLSARVTDALQTKVQRGGWVGRIPYGYRSNAGQLTVNEAQAAGYALAVKTILDGATTYSEIAQVLNAAGYRTRRGYPWTHHAVAYMLQNPAYLGLVPAGRRGQAALIPGLHPPLLDRETWERVQTRCRAMTPAAGPAHRAAVPYPLSGVLFCARCGARLVGGPGGRDGYLWRCYRCGKGKLYHTCDLPRIKADTIEELVARLLDGIHLPATWREQVLQAARQEQPAGPTAEAIAGEERRLTQLYQDGFIEYGEFKEKWGKVQARRQAATPAPIADTLALGELLDRGLGRLWQEAADAAAQQALARAVFAAIYVDWEKRATPRIARVEWAPALVPLRAYLDVGQGQWAAVPVITR